MLNCQCVVLIGKCVQAANYVTELIVTILHGCPSDTVVYQEISMHSLTGC
jgi:hypothetical protein